MTPIYLSPSIEQIEMMVMALGEKGIQSCIIAKQQNDGQYNAPRTMHELWLRKQTDRPLAKSIVTQQEFNTMRRNMEKVPVKTHLMTQPVDINEFYEVEEEEENFTNSRPITSLKKAYCIPINLIHVFKRLGGMLGVAESDMGLNKFYRLYKPWDSDSLMKSVEALKKKTHSGRPT